MKKNIVYLFVFLFTLFFITGCATPVSYSFAENDKDRGTATITFVGKKKTGVDLFYFEDVELPVPQKYKYWAPVTFPAGRPFTLTVSLYFYQEHKGNEVKFNCPMLTAGENYKLSLEIIDEKRSFGKITREGSEKLILSNAKTNQVVYEQKVR